MAQIHRPGDQPCSEVGDVGRPVREEPHKECWCTAPQYLQGAGKEPVRNDVYPTVPSLD